MWWMCDGCEFIGTEDEVVQHNTDVNALLMAA